MNGKIKPAKISRRRLIQFGAGAIGTGALTLGLGSKSFSQTAPAKTDLTPDQALQKLMEGNDRFVNRRTINSTNRDIRRIKQVSKTQTPFASILGCADSRVPSEIIFDQGFGDLFVCRVAGNIATTEEIGSLEFGAAELGTKVIMVLGHERCGAVTATIKGAQVPGQIGTLIEAIKPAVERSKGQPGDQLENACKANVLLQIEKLKSSPVLAGLIKEGKLKITGGYYDLDTGKVSMVS